MAKTTVRQERETVVKLGGADYLATREKNELILEDHNEVQLFRKAESGGAGQPVVVIININVPAGNSPHGKPPAGRFKRTCKEVWKLTSGAIKICIDALAKALCDSLFRS